jgi:hypothetical protein
MVTEGKHNSPCCHIDVFLGLIYASPQILDICFTLYGKNGTTSDIFIYYNSPVHVKYHYTFCTETQLSLLFFLLLTNKKFQTI